MKILTTPIFLVGLIYRWGKGLKTKNLVKNIKYVPQFGGHLIYVPHVPQLGDSWGTKTSGPQDGDKFTDFWIDLMKI